MKTNQPNTTPIKDIEGILSKFAVYCMLGRQASDYDEKAATQAIQTYIDNKILEARIDELYLAPKSQYIADRLNELKSNQSKG